MANPLLASLQKQTAPQQPANPLQMLAEFRRFASGIIPLQMLAEFRRFASGITPQQAQTKVEELLQSGQMSQEQFESLKKPAQDFMEFLK